MLAKTGWPSDYQEAFWEAYPRRVAKKAALRALDKVRKAQEVPFEVLLSAVKCYARAMKHKDMQYVAHPTTWLNQGRWDDEPNAITGGNRNTSTLALELADELRARESAAGLDGSDIWVRGR